MERFLSTWGRPTISDAELALSLGLTPSQRYGLVNRAFKKGTLMRLMRGLYLVPPPFNQQIPHPYAFAQSICSPSYISFESSLEYHGLIPEVSHVIQCATSKRSRSFANVLAEYRYTHIPGGHLYMGVERIATDEATFFMANPWKALADHYYVRRRPWSGLEDAMEDLRIDREDLLATDLGVLQELAEHYPVVRVRKMLKCWMRGL